MVKRIYANIPKKLNLSAFNPVVKQVQIRKSGLEWLAGFMPLGIVQEFRRLELLLRQ
jgi:hypothetical protein